MKKKFKKSDSSVIARNEATKQSREGTWVHWIATSSVGAFRNDDGQKIAASSVAMTEGLGWQ